MIMMMKSMKLSEMRRIRGFGLNLNMATVTEPPDRSSDVLNQFSFLN